jgi:multisubunit Na+/H+ antiporter MnhB subunit
MEQLGIPYPNLFVCLRSRLNHWNRQFDYFLQKFTEDLENLHVNSESFFKKRHFCTGVKPGGRVWFVKYALM